MLNAIRVNRRRWACKILLGVLAATPVAGRAAPTFTLTASPQFEFDSNVYDLPSGFILPGVPGSHGDRVNDFLQIYRASAMATDAWGPQSVHASVEGAEFRYDRNPNLDHNDFLLDAGIKWELLSQLTGSLDVAHSRSMVPFSVLLQQQQSLTEQTAQREKAIVDYQFAPSWRFEASGSASKVETPEPNAPDLSLRENSGTLALLYVANAGLNWGGNVSYATGDFGIPPIGEQPPHYHQTSENATVDYTATGLSKFDGSLGYTKRESLTGTDNLAGVTGSFLYQRQLTGKTSMDLSVGRQINAIIAGTGSEIDRTAAAIFKWQATYKLAASLGYTYTGRFLPGEGTVPGTDRHDREQYLSLNIDFQWLPWLTLRPYANIRTRKSDALYSDYNASIFGITFVAQYRR